MSYTDQERRELSMFGVRKTPSGEWKPILERVDTNRCTKCNGFGTYGIPMCGAVYTCDRCKGTGHEPESLKILKIGFWKKLFNLVLGWFKR